MSAELASSARARFRLSSLGETCLTRESDDGLTEELLRGGKVLALLIYVACQEGRPVSREELADLLWGDESPVNARASLRQALYALRRLVGEQVLGGDRHHVTLAPGPIAFDRDRFVLGARSGDLATMLEAYRGAFCPTLEVGEARRILEWIEEERHRLRHLLLDVAHRALPQLLRAGPATQALTAARRVHQLVPDDLVTFILLVDALIAAGSIHEARERVASAVAIRRAAGEGIPEPLRTREQRLARHDPDAAPLRGTLDALGHTLVGREAPIQQLLVEAERARLGEPRRIVVTGSMGIGKTRLLDEVEARLRLRGARVIRVRLLPAMREVPYAALADLVRALVKLPGSLGIAEGAARELVTLLPELSARYPNATPINREEGDRRLPRREALGDLLAAVADERLVVILLDDVAWADERSRQVIAGVTRGARLHLLEVLTTRPGWSLEELSAERQLPLQPLLPEELRFLLEEVAPLPIAPWADALIAQLAERSRGIPQAVLQLIRSAAAAGYLVPTPDGWRSDDPDRLLAEVSTRSWLEEGFADLSPMALRLLILLSRWGRPIDERELIALVRGNAARTPEEEVTAALRRLETLGLIISRDATWVVAHASVAEAALARADERESQATLEHLVRFWGEPARLDVELLEHLALLAGTGGERSLLLRLAQSAARAPRIRALELRGRRLARRIARAAGHPEWEGACLRAMGFLARQEGWGLTIVGAAATLVVGVLLWFAVMLQPRLRFEVEPLAEGPTLGMIDLAVQPRLVLENGFGRRYQWSLPTELSSEDYEVIGDTRRPLEEGQAQFERIAIRITTEDRARDAVLRAAGPWYVRSAAAPVRGSRTLATNSLFRVIAAKVDDVPLAPDLSVVVPPGDSLRLTLTFAYSTTIPTVNYVVGALPTWGQREREVVRLAGLPSPVVDAWRTVVFSVPPPPRGTNHIVLLFAAEDGVDYLFSLTNWTYGRPSWYDGNDVPDLGVEAFETLRRQGYLSDIPYRHARHGVRLARPWFPLREFPPTEAVYDVGVRLMGTAIRVTVDSTVARPRPG